MGLAGTYGPKSDGVDGGGGRLMRVGVVIADDWGLEIVRRGPAGGCWLGGGRGLSTWAECVWRSGRSSARALVSEWGGKHHRCSGARLCTFRL